LSGGVMRYGIADCFSSMSSDRARFTDLAISRKLIQRLWARDLRR